MIALLAVALAQDAIPEGQVRSVPGPAVVLAPSVYRRYVGDSRDLDACLAEAEAGLERERELRALLDAEIDAGGREIEGCTAQVVELGDARDRLQRRLVRVQRQRNVALGAAGVAVAVIVGAIALR